MRKVKGSALEGNFKLVLMSANLHRKFVREHQFHPSRKWRFDFADPENKVAVECDGGVFANSQGQIGGHTRGAGFRDNCEKLNAAAALGWVVFRYVQKKGMMQFLEDYRALLESRQESHSTNKGE